MVKSQTVSISPAQHASRHAVGGADPLVAPLLPHVANHAPGGSDVLDKSELINNAGVNIYTGNSPGTTWTDLDLSSEIGAVKTLVALRFFNTGSGVQDYFGVRGKDDATDYYHGTVAGNVQSGVITDAKYTVYIVLTDAAGIIQWYTSTARPCTVDILWSISMP